MFQQDIRTKLLRVIKLDSSVVKAAQNLVSTHGMTRGIGLRTLDTLQLGTAKILMQRGLRRFVTSDKRLRLAAEEEGFELSDPETATEFD